MDSHAPITFSKHHSKLIVGVLDIVKSTEITSTLSADEVDSFYTIFLEEFTRAIFQAGGVVVKNVGDGILFYFTGEPTEAVVVSLGLLELRPHINKRLIGQGLPMISYRISMSFGPVSAMINSKGSIVDIFGATVSTCAKFNKAAQANSVIIGEALSEHLEAGRFEVHNAGRYQVRKDFSFPLYEVQLK